MSLEVQVLGGAGRDNALLVRVHTGQALTRLLFDCGEGCLSTVPFAEIQRIDHLLFSHLHMDHVGGFDSFFRCTYNRTMKPNVIWGPPETTRIMHHRFQGFLWNLHQDSPVEWRVCDVHEDTVHTSDYAVADAFATVHAEGDYAYDGRLLSTPDFTVSVLAMEHLTPSLAYVVRESPRKNIDVTRLQDLGLRPGPWLQQLKDGTEEQQEITVEGTRYSLAELRDALLVATPGDAVAYLTDFRLDDDAYARLVPFIRHCRVVVCESAYLYADHELAEKNYHMTAEAVAELARRAEVGKLILIHLSDRYPREEWPQFLHEARRIFPNTHFPGHWGIDL